ncbi:DEAD/DEAH box helicase [Balneatrix alpica]|uniref:DEAD/DEAH box helicase n=1 Tax=Balneatrix alpica TaxID=75684 RepID=UPI0027396523|nr:DEAD/DEAH box helicase [Balneatrix alpica]
MNKRKKTDTKQEDGSEEITLPPQAEESALAAEQAEAESAEQQEDGELRDLADISSFDELGLEPALLMALEQQGLLVPTEVQRIAIPHGLDGEDVLICAHTGTGKTLAYLLPLLQQLMDKAPAQRDEEGLRGLILVPTRELAAQVFRIARVLAEAAGMHAGLVQGGVSYTEQIERLQLLPQVLVATPGRLLDLVLDGHLSLHQLQALVLDEADRMVEMGFTHQLYELIERLGPRPQTWLCSATLDNRELEDFCEQTLQQPVEVILSRSDAASSVQQWAIQADNEQHKLDLLLALLKRPEVKQALIFVSTRKQVESLAAHVRRLGDQCEGLHGEMSQKGRSFILGRFRRGKTRFLVATDVASRGLDIGRVSHVLNYNLPFAADDYVHRIGRTGRAGETGTAWSLIDTNDFPLLGRMERYQDIEIPWMKVAGLEPKKKLKLKPRKTKVKDKKGSKAVAKKKPKPSKLKARKTGKA